MSSSLDPVYKVALPFAGHPWAQPNAQVPVPADHRLVVTAPEIRWRAVPFDGLTESALPVDGDGTTIDMVVVKIKPDGRVDAGETLARTVTLKEAGGFEAPVGKQFTEEDVNEQETIALGIVSVTQDTAAALWVYIDTGARRAG